jgi:hypothetical protein
MFIVVACFLLLLFLDFFLVLLYFLGCYFDFLLKSRSVGDVLLFLIPVEIELVLGLLNGEINVLAAVWLWRWVP